MSPAELDDARNTLIAYLKMKVDQADWHGVSDAANDLRVLEAQQGSQQQQITQVTHLRPFTCEELGIHQEQQGSAIDALDPLGMLPRLRRIERAVGEFLQNDALGTGSVAGLKSAFFGAESQAAVLEGRT